MAHSRKKLNLLGQRYGRLVVIATAENIGWRTAWLCRCDCGQQLVVKTYHLRSGHVTSCGCARSGGFDERLHYLEGTCVEMLQAKTVRCNTPAGCLVWIGWRPEGVDGLLFVLRGGVTFWVVLSNLPRLCRPASKRKQLYTMSLCVIMLRRIVKLRKII